MPTNLVHQHCASSAVLFLISKCLMPTRLEVMNFVHLSLIFFFQVFNAYQAGVGALKLSMKDVTVERAENLVDQIQEVLE